MTSAPVPNLNPNDLVIFHVVAEEKSLSSAAERLFLTQPAVTYHIQSLEEYARVKLIEFRKRQAVLTPYGEGLFRYAKAIYKNLVEAERLIQFIRESNFRVGMSSIYNNLLGPLLRSMFEEKNPEIRLNVKSGDALELVQDVADLKLDLAIVPQFDYQHDKLDHVQVSYPERIICFAGAQLNVSGEPLAWRDLRQYALIAGPETSVIRRIIFDKFKKEGLELPVLAAEVGDIEWCKKLVENGKGLSFTTVHDIEEQLKTGRLKLVPLQEYVYVAAESVTHPNESNPIIRKFIAMVKEAFGFKDGTPPGG